MSLLLFILLLLVAMGLFVAFLTVAICLNNAKRKKQEYRIRENDFIQKYGYKPIPEGYEED